MVTLVENKTFVVFSVYEEVFGIAWRENAEKFIKIYEQYRNRLPENARSRDFTRRCVECSFTIPDLIWHGRCDTRDPNWVSPVKIQDAVNKLLQAGFYLPNDPYPKIVRESMLD